MVTILTVNIKIFLNTLIITFKKYFLSNILEGSKINSIGERNY